MENNTSDLKKQRELEGLQTRHRAERLSALTGETYDTYYFAKIHNRSRQRINDAFNGKASALLKKINQRLDFLEEKHLQKESVEA